MQAAVRPRQQPSVPKADDGLDPSTGEPFALTVRGLGKQYSGNRWTVKDLSFDVPHGEIFGLIGPSGIGKSTILNMIAGFVRPTTGRVVLRGVDVTDRPSHKRSFGMVFQDYALFPHLTAAENIAFGLRLRRMDRKKREQRVRELLEFVSLSERGHHFPRELSGGEQQRVGLARALATDPPLILLDEPLVSLDTRLREQMRREIKRILKAADVSAVMVTHDPVEAFDMCDRLGIMEDGTIAQAGTPDEIYRRPSSLGVAELLGDINVLSGIAGPVRPSGRIEVTMGSGHVTDAHLGAPLSAGDEGWLLVRPEAIRLVDQASPSSVLGGTVLAREMLGHVIRYRVMTSGGQRISCIEMHGVSNHEVGTQIGIHWESSDVSFVRPTAGRADAAGGDDAPLDHALPGAPVISEPSPDGDS
jgi:putative spermidine/putrescine transport system ATP-binding protein